MLVLDELTAATGWQGRSIRGFLSTACKRQNLKIEATRKDGVTTYKLAEGHSRRSTGRQPQGWRFGVHGV